MIIINAIANDIATVTKVYQPFSERFRKVINHPPEPGMRPKYLHSLPDRLTGPTRGVRVLRAKKVT